MVPILKGKRNLIWLILLVLLSCMFSLTTFGESMNTEILSDFDVFEVDIRDVFRSLAEIGNINVLLDPSVKGEATIKLKHGLKIKEAIEMLAQTYGYSYRWMQASRTVLIGNEKTFTGFETKETKVYQLNYGQIDQVVSALGVAVPKDAIGVDKRTNQLTIRASVLEHQNIEEIIKRLDREMPQINIEARVEEITKSASEELGMTWNFPAFTWSNTSGEISYSVSTEAKLSALESKNKARLIARPNISTIDSQEGKIFIGERYPIVTTDEDGKTNIEYVEFGTTLKVTPRINEDNVVTVSVQALVSSDKKWITLTDGNTIPLVATREASSVVRLHEGETFILSGLNLSKSQDGKSGIPGLGRIPVVGRLFGSKNDSEEDTELVIFLTPKIVHSKKSVTEKAPVKSSVVEAPNNSTEEITPSETQPQPETSPATQLSPAESETKPEEDKAEAAAGVTQPVVPASEALPETQPEEAQKEAAEPQQPVSQEAVPEVQPASDEEQVQQESLQTSENEGKEAIPVGYIVNYKVKSGDTLATISQKYGVAAEGIAQANKIKDNSGLTVGQKIKIPIPEDHLYTLKPKETLWRLAKRYGTTVEVLMELNNLSDYTTLSQGQQIILPVSKEQIVDTRF